MSINGLKIRKIKNGKTDDVFAAEIGIGRTSLNKMYSGGDVKLSVVERLSEVSGKPIDWFCDRYDEKTNTYHTGPPASVVKEPLDVYNTQSRLKLVEMALEMIAEYAEQNDGAPGSGRETAKRLKKVLKELK